MTELNLPRFSPRLRQSGIRTEIFDLLRHRYVALTPEENVRQHFVNYLVVHLGYPSGLMANEVSLSLNGLTRRCDTVLYDRELHPRMIIEYKRPSVHITQRVFDQVSRYNIVMKVDYLIVSNGLTHYCCKMYYDGQTYEFLDEIPMYENLKFK